MMHAARYARQEIDKTRECLAPIYSTPSGLGLTRLTRLQTRVGPAHCVLPGTTLEHRKFRLS